MKKTILSLLTFFLIATTNAIGQTTTQGKSYYDEKINPMEQIDNALSKAKPEGKYVVCQVGGNWCKWCRWFGKFIEEDADIAKVINDNFVYIHVNYGKANEERTQQLIKRLKNPGRFGFPVLIVLDSDGNVIHTQATGYLEEGDGYDKKRVLEFFNLWTPTAVSTVVR